MQAARGSVRLVPVLVLALLAGAAALVAQAPKRPGPESRVIDPKAIPLLEAMDAAFAQAQGLSATYHSTSTTPAGRASPSEVLTLNLGRPNVYRMEFANGRKIVSNGTARFDVTASRCTMADVTPLNDAREIDTFNPIYWSFYDLGQWQVRSAMLGHWVTKWRLADPGLRTVRYIGREDLAGTPVDVIEWTYTISYNRPDDDPVYTSRIAIGPDHFPRRIETTSSSKDEYKGRRIVETISDIKVLPKPAVSEFAFAPPNGASCPKVNQEDPYITGKYADLPNGSKAPDFTVKSARGETIQFSAFLKQHKVVLMNFWGYT
jgi:outer membrane lipoprotein-sorting protein